MNNRTFTTVYDHPAFVPTPIPHAPSLQLRDGTELPGLGAVLFLPLNQLTQLPVGYLNLLCATMLPDTHDLSIPQCMRTLGEWTVVVKRETQRLIHMFRRNPADYNNSESYFRVLLMVTVLQRDLGVKYDADCINSKEFKSSREGFIHGLLTGNKTGTCANLPVLYAAIGRNLGYPIYLVGAKGHWFCRWHNARTGERFNIEGSGRGLSVHPDDYYMKWPNPLSKEEVHHGLFLRNLDPAEELGHFMATRGHCLRDKGHVLDAILAYSHAHRLAPTDPCIMANLLTALNTETEMRRDGRLPCTYRQTENFPRPDSLPQARFIIDDRYGTRVAGVNLDENDSGRMAPAE